MVDLNVFIYNFVLLGSMRRNAALILATLTGWKDAFESDISLRVEVKLQKCLIWKLKNKFNIEKFCFIPPLFQRPSLLSSEMKKKF